jgi:hypothetical protein
MPMPQQNDLMMPTLSNETHFKYDRCLENKIRAFFNSHFVAQEKTSLNICNQALSINFCSSKMAQKYMPALQHLKTTQDDGHDKSFTLYVLDVASITEHDFPRFLTDFFCKGVSLPEGRPTAGHFLAFDDFAYYYNSFTNWGIWFVHQYERFSQWHFANPFRFFLYDWLIQKNYQLVHASAISNGTTALLFAGASGSGKSTTALRALNDGYSLLGDDHCAISLSAEPRAFSLYNAVKLDAQLVESEFKSFQIFVKERIHTQKINKVIINLTTINPAFMSNDLPIKALVCLSIDKNANGPRLLPIPSSKALKHILLTTVEQCAWPSRKQTMSNIHTLVSQLPCYHLTLCPNHPKNLAQIRALFHD